MSTLWKDDAELFELVRRELFTAVVGDVMDQMGLQHQFLPPQIRPLHPEMIVVGPAMTVLSVDVDVNDEEACIKSAQRPFGLMLEALDDLRPREVYLVSGVNPQYALWGELMSARAQQLGAAGAVMNGYSRDTRGILACGFPTFSWGPYAQDQAPRGKVIDFRVSIEVVGVRVNPGDTVFGDVDGVCVIPSEARDMVFGRALERARGENEVRIALEQGMTAVAAFSRHGIM